MINDKGGIPLDMAQVLLSQVGGALAYAHRKGVVHRDIKPANIMIDEDGWAIVTDFGIAKVTVESNLTATGTAIGTPHYMSPEQFHNKAVTGASDQYALGIVAYEMLTGKKPFDGGTYAEIITQHLFEAPPDPRALKPDIPEGAVNVIKKMLAKDPAERYADCEQAAAAFAAVHLPAKQSGDVVRTQMISLAKSGPQKKVRMSVPMSPIPVQKKPAASAATAIEPAAGAKVKKAGKPVAAAGAAPAPAVKSGGAGKWIALVLLLLAAAGGGYWYKFLRPQPAAQVASNTANTAVSVPSVSPAPALPDSAALAAAAKARQDSIENATAERLSAKADSISKAKARRDSIANAKASAKNTRPPTRIAASTSVKTSESAAQVAPVQQQAAPPPAPVVPQFGEVRLGTPAPEAFLYINGRLDGAISTAVFHKIPAGEAVKLEIKSAKCTATWDTTVTVAANAQMTIGRRLTSGCQ